MADVTLSAVRRLGTPLLLSAVAAAGCAGVAEARPTSNASSDRTMQQLERIVRERVDSKRSTGIVAGMVFSDGRTRVVAYGDAGKGRRLDARSVLEIGSITKTFTGTLLADMVQRGELSLSDPVAGLLPAGVSVPSRGGRQITLEDLATHTSGLPRMPTNHRPGDADNPYADYTVEQLYSYLARYRLTRDPGSRFEYSNLGVGLLGHALALRAGTSYEDLVRERILQPLDMTSTGIAVTAQMSRHLASGHDEAARVTARTDLPALAGAGALRSSITDMLRFAAANLRSDGGSLGQAMAAARTPRRKTDAKGRIGLNWITDSLGRRELTWHDGATTGFTSFIALDAARQTAIVVLSNSRAGSVDDIGFHLLDRSLPLMPAPEKPAPPRKRTEIKVAPRVLQRYVGVYDLPGPNLTITRSRHGLSGRIEGQPVVRLYAETRRRFFLKVVDAQVTFQLHRRRGVTGLVLHQDGQAVRAGRIG